MMSGCKDNQTSADAYDNFAKESVGAFTCALITTLRANKHNIDFKNLYGSLCNCLLANRFPQVPMISFSTLNPEYKFVRALPVTIKTVDIPAPVSSGTGIIIPMKSSRNLYCKIKMFIL
jgi:hypothetical protein